MCYETIYLKMCEKGQEKIQRNIYEKFFVFFILPDEKFPTCLRAVVKIINFLINLLGNLFVLTS